MKKINTSFWMLLLTLFIGGYIQNIHAQTILEASDNVYVKGGTSADSNYVGDQYIRVRGAIGNNARKTYLKFDLHTVTSPFVKAELLLNAHQIVAIAGGIPNTADVFTVSDDNWSQSTVTWNTAPQRINYLFSQTFLSKTSTSADTIYSLDITNYVKSEFQGDKIVSICMMDTANLGSDIRIWANRNILVTGPQLKLSNNGVTISAPVGGETWQVGTTQNITWTSTGITNVKIEYTTNNGSLWNTIIASTPAAASSYAWSIPNTTSIQCKVRVSDVSDATVSSSSQSAFTIYDPSASLAVVSPNGGENWAVGDLKNITWTSNSVNNVKIEYTLNNGASWYTAASKVSAASGSFSWTIPYPPSAQCKVKISDASFPNITDMSDASFAIYDLPNSMYHPTGNLYVQNGTAADSLYAADTLLRVRGSTDPNTQRKTYMKFDVSNFNGNLGKAILQFTINRVVAITGGLINRSDIFTVNDDSWNPATLTWNTAPMRNTYLLTQEYTAKTTTQVDTLYRIDVSGYVQSELAGNKVVSFCMIDTLNNGTDVRFWSTRPLIDQGPALILYNVTGVKDNLISRPDEFAVAQNYPNPFNPSTEITFNIPRAGNVRIAIYDVLGNEVRVLNEGFMHAGYNSVTWNGKLSNGLNASSGIYLCSVRYSDAVKTIKMLLAK